MAKQRASHPRRRRRLLVLLLLLLALLAGELWWSNCTLSVEPFTYVSSRLPAGFDGFRIVQLSDLHEAEFGEDNETLLSTVAEQEPDLIAITGDLVDRFQGPDPQYVDTLCRGLVAIAPTYFITGNHEWAVGDVPELKDCLLYTSTFPRGKNQRSAPRGTPPKIGGSTMKFYVCAHCGNIITLSLIHI